MDRISFDIYKPDGKLFHVTLNLIVFSSWFLAIGVCWLFSQNNSTLRLILVLLVFVPSIILLPVSFLLYKPLNGTLEGKIIFEGDKIIVNNIEYNLADMTDLDLFFYDFYGQKSSNGRNFNQKLSQGVSNYIRFVDKKGEEHKIYMKFQGQHSYSVLGDFINEAVQKNKMTESRASELINFKSLSFSI